MTSFRRALWVAGAPARMALAALIMLWRLTVGPLLGATIAPLVGSRCRFHPSCSAYALEAVRVHGALRGGVLAVWRVLRCSPLSPGGLDLVPPRRAPGLYDSVVHEGR